MSANDGKATGHSRTIALYAVRREERIAIVGPVVCRSFAANEFNISLRQAKTSVCVVICNAFDERLSGAKRHRNELAKNDRTPDREWRKQQACAADQDQRRTQPFAALIDDRKQQGHKGRQQKG